jgi:hypothetical protein
MKRRQRGAPGADRILGKTPANLACVIHLALLNARIIHVRCDPVDICFSCFSPFITGRQPSH